MARRIITPRGRQSRLEGMAEIQERLSAIVSRSTGIEVKRVYMRGAIMLRDAAKGLAPVKTGRLRDAIFASYGDRAKPDVLVGVNYKKAPHAHLVEYGTSHSAPHPYMRPAIRTVRNAVVSTIAEGLRQVLTERE